MDTLNPPLPQGFTPIPAGMLATIVTCLEMTAAPAARPTPPADGLSIDHWPAPSIEAYRALYRQIGEEWLWMSRVVMKDDELAAILSDPAVEIYTLMQDGQRVGLLELDFRQEGECELAFFGVDQAAIGKGAGRFLMNAAIAHAWAKPIRRFWVHTCNLDHPAALSFYQRSGFTAYDRMIEVFEDPRLTGKLRADAATHAPVIAPAVQVPKP
ncbi:MAG: GNAT family N-acetyltransferase [Rhizobium sp.]|nr:GNAT family N-acetyltransferase [Rhizobium sp.]